MLLAYHHNTVFLVFMNLIIESNDKNLMLRWCVQKELVLMDDNNRHIRRTMSKQRRHVEAHVVDPLEQPM